MKTIIYGAIAANVLLIIEASHNLFLQTHWGKPDYVWLVAIVLGTPMINIATLAQVLHRRRSKSLANPLAPPATRPPDSN